MERSSPSNGSQLDCPNGTSAKTSSPKPSAHRWRHPRVPRPPPRPKSRESGDLVRALAGLNAQLVAHSHRCRSHGRRRRAAHQDSALPLAGNYAHLLERDSYGYGRKNLDLKQLSAAFDTRLEKELMASARLSSSNLVPFLAPSSITTRTKPSSGVHHNRPAMTQQTGLNS